MAQSSEVKVLKRRLLGRTRVPLPFSVSVLFLVTLSICVFVRSRIIVGGRYFVVISSPSLRHLLRSSRSMSADHDPAMELGCHRLGFLCCPLGFSPPPFCGCFLAAVVKVKAQWLGRRRPSALRPTAFENIRGTQSRNPEKRRPWLISSNAKETLNDCSV